MLRGDSSKDLYQLLRFDNGMEADVFNQETSEVRNKATTVMVIPRPVTIMVHIE